MIKSIGKSSRRVFVDTDRDEGEVADVTRTKLWDSTARD